MKFIIKNHTIATALNVPVKTNILTPLYIALLATFVPNISFIEAYIVFLTTYFVVVLGHEFAHVLAAKYYGYATQEVCINIFGGVAIIENGDSMNHKESFFVSIAGPLFNFILIPPLVLIGNEMLLMLNIFMMIFNLVPFYPLDGGRMLRAVIGNFVKDNLNLQRITFYISCVCFCGFIALSFYARNVALAIVSLLLLAYNYIQLQRVKETEKLDN